MENTKTKETVNETKASIQRKPRKKTYERIRESAIPDELVEHFKKDNYDLKLVRFMLQGAEDYRYLYRREREGYEFVQASEIPEKFKAGLSEMDTKSHQGLVTVGDLCLMKIDSDLRNSRRKYFQDETESHINAVDIHVLEKRGFRNLGTRTKVLTREPTFQE
jgi:hypothetical protein